MAYTFCYFHKKLRVLELKEKEWPWPLGHWGWRVHWRWSIQLGHIEIAGGLSPLLPPTGDQLFFWAKIMKKWKRVHSKSRIFSDGYCTVLQAAGCTVDCFDIPSTILFMFWFVCLEELEEAPDARASAGRQALATRESFCQGEQNEKKFFLRFAETNSSVEQLKFSGCADIRESCLLHMYHAHEFCDDQRQLMPMQNQYPSGQPRNLHQDIELILQLIRWSYYHLFIPLPNLQLTCSGQNLPAYSGTHSTIPHCLAICHNHKLLSTMNRLYGYKMGVQN